MSPLVDPRSDINLVKRSADAVVSHIPGLNIAWDLFKALTGNAMELRQQRTLEFVESIRDNPSIFIKEILESEQFQDGFVFAITEHIKIRSAYKRRLSLAIFKGFVATNDKVEFPLERFYDTLGKISTSSLQTLAFISSDIIPLRDKGIRDDLDSKDLSKSEKPYEWWYKRALKITPHSIYYESWIYDNYNPNSQAVMDRLNKGKPIQDRALLDETFEIERGVSERMFESIVELEYLGFIRYNVNPESISWSSVGASSWILTEFAYKFIEFLQDSP